MIEGKIRKKITWRGMEKGLNKRKVQVIEGLSYWDSTVHIISL